MTQTLPRRPDTRVPRRPPAAPAPPRRAPWGAGLVGAGWAVTGGLVAVTVPVLVVWAADPRSTSGATTPLRAAARIWLLAHGARLDLPGGPVGFLPLGLLALPVALLCRAAGHVARSTAAPAAPGRRQAVLAALAVSGPCLLAVAAAAGLARGVPLPRAVGAALGVCLAGAGLGAARATGRLRDGWLAVPAPAREVAVTAARAAGLLLAAGGLLGIAALAGHTGRVAALAGTGRPGVVGGLALGVACILALPNLAVWGAAWLAGPGVAVGTGTAVTPFAVHLGAVPPLPLFGALPAGPPPGWAAAAALVVPVACGAAAALLTRPATTPRAAAAGPVAGLLAAAAAALSGGPLGAHRLAAVGPSPWRVGLAVAAAVTAGATLAFLCSPARGARSLPDDD